jgi:hypothetical protein
MNAHSYNRCRTAFLRVICLAAMLLLLTLVSSCGLLRAPGKAVKAITPGTRPPATDPATTETMVQQMADEYILRTGQALDEYERIRGTSPETAVMVLQWKGVVLAYAMRIASGNNPYANLVDMVTLIDLNRAALEDYWIHTTNGPAFQPWLEASKILETNAWKAAGTVFSRAQVDQLRKTLDEYRRTHPNAEYPLFARPLDFSSALKATTARNESESSLLGWVGLDPSMGLDPTLQEVTRTRLFAERAMFTFQRMPTLMRLHMELLTMNVLHQPELQQTFTNTTRLTESVDRISRTAAELPSQVSTLMQQQEGPLRDLTAQVGRSLAQAEKTSDSLNVTLTSLDALMKRFGVGEPNTNPVVAVDTNSQPFRILDYAETAEKIGGMATNLTALIARVDQSTPQVTQLSQQAAADARQLVNHAFRMGLILIGVLLVGAVLACLLYRILARRFLDNKQPAALSESTRNLTSKS